MLMLNPVSCVSFYSGEGESSAGNDAAPKGISFTPFTPPELVLALVCTVATVQGGSITSLKNRA